MEKKKKILTLNGVVSAFGVILACATVAGYFGSLHWALDLFAHFRVQYLLCFIVVILYKVTNSTFKEGAFLAVFLLCNIFSVLPLYFGKRNVTVENPKRLFFCNVYTGNRQKDLLRTEIKKHNPDIIVLEEIDSVWLQELKWLHSQYSFSITKPRSDNFGIGVWSKTPFVDVKIEHIGSAIVPTVFATMHLNGQKVQLIATHPVPPVGSVGTSRRNDQLEKLPAYVDKNVPTILVGDLNTSSWGSSFKRLVKETALKNSAKGFGFQPSWPAGKPLLYIAIDHLLHSEEVVILDRKIGGDVGSDHLPLIVDFAVEK